jgi:3-methyladenine DNA glycosylase AlkC
MTQKTKQAGGSGRTMASITERRRADLNSGREPCATLTECLAVDFGVLARSCLPEAKPKTLAALADAQPLGIVRRMDLAGLTLLDDLGVSAISRLAGHRSDTVRGWACFMIGAAVDLDLADRLDRIRPLADDSHFGVREWAWVAVRPHLTRELALAIRLLTPWTADASANVRRFASEATRPRGVWCPHIVELKANPAVALPILRPLRADPERYVQDSVANWLNDASKDQPEWVCGLCEEWLRESDSPHTARICQRAVRTLTKSSPTPKRKTP